MEGLPDNPETDPRVHFNKESGKWAYEDDEGEEHEWDTTTEKWVKVVDTSLIEAQQRAYAIEGVDESEPAAPVKARHQKGRKRNASPDNNGGPPTKKSGPPQRNTAVYVTNLPIDPAPTESEIRQTFSKCGLILEDGDGNPRIKLYKDEKGNFNGECLVVFLQEGSVNLAVQLLDDTELRLGSGGPNMIVKPAEWSHKQHQDQKQQQQQNNNSNNNEKNNSSNENDKKPRGRKAPDPEKQKAQRRAERQKNSLNDWRDEEDEPLPDTKPQQQKASRVVVLSRMFTLNELDEDPTLSLELKEDVREECETIGDVTNVVLYDKEPEGVMTIRFKDPVSAKACVMKMDGRFFGGRQIIAQLYDGQRRFRKSGHTQEDEEEEEKRLDDFGKWLEEGGE